MQKSVINNLQVLDAVIRFTAFSSGELMCEQWGKHCLGGAATNLKGISPL